MKISKNSWHYRFNDFNNDNFSYRFEKGVYTTCSYIRTTIASFFAFGFKCTAILCALALVAWIIGSMVGVPLMVFMGATSLSDVFVVPCVVGWALTVLILFVTLVAQIKEWFQNLEFKTSDRPSKEPNVFVQAIIDKHNKFCTRVIAE